MVITHRQGGTGNARAEQRIASTKQHATKRGDEEDHGVVPLNGGNPLVECDGAGWVCSVSGGAGWLLVVVGSKKSQK